MMEIPSTVYTHAGKFHADDVFSTALLRLLRPELKVIRTAALPENFEGFAFDTLKKSLDLQGFFSP